MAASTGSLSIPARPMSRRIRQTYSFLRRWPVIPIFLLALVLVTGILAPWISPHSATIGYLKERNLPPVWLGPEYSLKIVVETPALGQIGNQIALKEAREINGAVQLGETIEVRTREGGSTKFLLGTDHLGRDILTRIIHGARISIIVGAVTLGVGGTVGVVLGMMAGWYGGWVDELLMRLVDMILALPLILVALVAVVALGQSLGIIVAVLALWIWPRFARMTRGEVLQLKTMDYVALARVSGASTLRILLVHLFPGTINTLIVVATLQVGIVILVEAVLSFLGAGVPPPTPAWGSMVSDGRDRLADAWWIATMPGIAILLTVMSLNLFGDWLRDKLDPRLRQIE
jgi:peptide/nickel transport system permease protein